MATTLVNLRAKLNGELGVLTDAETAPWATTVRNNAISDGYADLWRQGVWKAAKQDLSSADDTWTYALTSIRKLNRVEVIDGYGTVGEGKARIEEDGVGGYQLVLATPIAVGFTIRVFGWTAYKSTFSGDADTDDLAAEYNRIPLLKAKAILYRQQLSLFARYGERQAVAPEMNVSIDQLVGIISAAEREYADACRELSGLRPRVGQARRFRA
ncbi:MAG: hypothetical protein FIA92_02775 [Chloroflexi bacterium]|nr:hypothetical protein [Chloroflexota bacterium]